MKKPENDPVTYEKPLPLDLLPYHERNDKYQSMGTAFSLGHNTYVTAAHVLGVGIDGNMGLPNCARRTTRYMPSTASLDTPFIWCPSSSN